jgi:hypothetical protein
MFAVHAHRFEQPGLPATGRTVAAATAVSWSSYATKHWASTYGDPAAIACQRSSVNVDLSNDARWTADRTCANSGPVTSIRTPQSSTGFARSRRSGVHGSSASHPSSSSSSWNNAPNRASMYTSPCGRTPRSG